MTTEQLFETLLHKRTVKNAVKFDRDLTQKLETTGAVLVCDSSGFTKMTRRRGILHFLAMLMQSYALSRPVVRKFKGRLIKSEADNLIAVFKTPKEAVECAMEIQRLHRKRNENVPHADNAFYICIGIQFGKYLDLKDDVFGDAVNVAYKLGEDLAGREEIFITEEVRRKIGKKYLITDMGLMDVGRIDTQVYRVEWLATDLQDAAKTSDSKKQVMR